MERAKKGKLSRQQVFKTLCDKSGVECELVSGIAKSAGFEPGLKDTSKFKSTWNKVKLEGLWWPVYPDWIMQSANKAGKVVHIFTECWFLAPPEIFILKCYPDNVSDQMLPAAKQIKTEKKFLKLPVLSNHFFKYNLTLTSEESSLLDTDNGKCVISFKTDSAAAKRLTFFPKLTMPEGSADQTQYTTNQLVACTRRKGRFAFEVRCPVLGEYKIQIRGGPRDKIEEEDKPFYTAKIDCFELPGDFAQLPIDTGLIGWGHGPTAEEHGLLKPTQKEPKILAKLGSSQTKLSFGFTLKQDVASLLTFDAVLHGGAPSFDYKAEAEIKKSSDRIAFNTTIRNPGEYALAIYATGSKEAGQCELICAYLINTEEDPDDGFSDESLDDGFSDIDEENYQLEREVTDLEERYAELLERAQTAMSVRGK